MPIYCFKCEECGLVHDDLRQMCDSNKPSVCKKCGGVAERAIGFESPGIISEGNIRISRSLAQPIDKVKSGEAFKIHPGADFNKPNRAGMCSMNINSRSEKLRRIKERSKINGIPLQEM